MRGWPYGTIILIVYVGTTGELIMIIIWCVHTTGEEAGSHWTSWRTRQGWSSWYEYTTENECQQMYKQRIICVMLIFIQNIN